MTQPRPDGVVPIDLFVQEELKRRAAYEALPSTVRRHEIEGEAATLRQAARDARRKRPKFQQTTDYPWLKPDWKW